MGWLPWLPLNNKIRTVALRVSLRSRLLNWDGSYLIKKHFISDSYTFIYSTCLNIWTKIQALYQERYVSLYMHKVSMYQQLLCLYI